LDEGGGGKGEKSKVLWGRVRNEKDREVGRGKVKAKKGDKSSNKEK